MNANRRIAVVAGVLFIIATVADLISRVALVQPILSAPVDLAKISANENQVLLGALFLFIGAAAAAGIAIALYPVLRKHSEGLALGSVGFRLIEGALYLGIVVCLLLLVTLSQESANAGAAASSAYAVPGALLMAARDSLGEVAVLAFGLGALMYYVGVLSIATRPSMAVSLGSCGHRVAHGVRPPGHVRPYRADVDDPGRPGSSDLPAGDGPGGLADRQGLQPICHRSRVCR